MLSLRVFFFNSYLDDSSIHHTVRNGCGSGVFCFPFLSNRGPIFPGVCWGQMQLQAIIIN